MNVRSIAAVWVMSVISAVAAHAIPLVGPITDAGSSARETGQLSSASFRPCEGMAQVIAFIADGGASSSSAVAADAQGDLSFGSQAIDTTSYPAPAVTPTIAPETSTLTLFGAGIFGLAGLVKRRSTV